MQGKREQECVAAQRDIEHQVWYAIERLDADRSSETVNVVDSVVVEIMGEVGCLVLGLRERAHSEAGRRRKRGVGWVGVGGEGWRGEEMGG